jgi:hypothetical protein
LRKVAACMYIYSARVAAIYSFISKRFDVGVSDSPML